MIAHKFKDVLSIEMLLIYRKDLTVLDKNHIYHKHSISKFRHPK